MKENETLELAKAMLACRTMRDRKTRDTILDQLPDGIKNTADRHDADHVDVVNIVKRCQDFDGGLDTLVNILRVFEGDSRGMKNLLFVFKGDGKTNYIADLEKEARKLENNEAYAEAVDAWEQVLYFEPENRTAGPKIERLQEIIRLKAELLVIQQGLNKRMGEIIHVYPAMSQYVNRMEKSGVDGNGAIFLNMARSFLTGDIDGGQFVLAWNELQKAPVKTKSRPNYQMLAERFMHGEIIPFFGSHISHKAEPVFPSPEQVIEKLAVAAGYNPFSGDLPMIAQYYQMAGWGRKLLIRNAKSATSLECKIHDSNPLFRLAAKNPAAFVAVSATYGNVLESVFRENRKKFAVITHCVPLKTEHEFGKVIVFYSDRDKPEPLRLSDTVTELRLLENGYSVIYKIHGCFGLCSDKPGADADTLVISEEDFQSFLKYIEKIMPNYLLRLISNQCLLFLGYRLNEWRDRLVAGAILEKRRTSRERSFVICPDPTPYEQAFWKYHGVELYDEETEVFAEKLGEAMNV